MPSKFVVVLFSLCVLSCVTAQEGDDDHNKAVDKSRKILAGLYVTLRNIAFPGSPLTSGTPIANRFVLMSPGKVLNYWDYYPGQAYEQSLLHQNVSALDSVVPPSVMEKWFDIADVMVGADPLTGGVTGKSMAAAYETIISQMELLGLTSKSNDAEGRFVEGRDYLTAVVPDPDNPAMNSTRLTLYKRYQDLYTQSQLDMEQAIYETRSSRSALEYELWFQRNYPSLAMRVEGAYTQWLVFGEKEKVELYKAYMDVASSGSEIEKAKMALRMSGVSSLDRTRTVYPVSFEPGNWYKYLLPKIKGPSRDMVLAKRSLVESEISTLTTMTAFSSSSQNEAKKTLDALNGTVAAATAEQKNKTEEAMKARHKCMQSNIPQSPSNVSNGVSTPVSESCSRLRSTMESAVDSTFNQAQVTSQYQSAAFILNTKQKFNSFLNARVSSLKQELAELNSELERTEPYLGPIADSREFQDLHKVLNATEQSLDDEWLQFEYNSDSSHASTSQETTSVDVAVGLSFSTQVPGGFSAGGSVNVGVSHTDLEQSIKSTSVRVAGELLRVTIKRPWFKPSIFEDTSLSFSTFNEEEQKATYVSPGPKDESTFRDYVAGTKENRYLMPEYVTGFLLARNVKLQFSGVDARSTSHLTQLTVETKFSASYKMFTLSGAVGVGHQKQSTTVDRTSDGMIINIPGAQVIGYYTTLLPKFPLKQRA